jgi:membrane protein
VTSERANVQTTGSPPEDTAWGAPPAVQGGIRLLSRRSVITLGRELVNGFLQADVMGLGKQVAYSFIFATVPTMFLLVALSALIEHQLAFPVTAHARELIEEYAPADVQDVLLSLLDQAITRASTQVASVSAIVAFSLALWGGMSAIYTLIEATNRAYGVRNTRPFVEKRAMALIFTLAFTVMLALSVTVMFFGERIVAELSRRVGDHPWWVEFGQLTQLSIAASMAALTLLLLYRFGPSVDQSMRWVIPGAIVAALAWLGLLRVFSLITDRLAIGGIYGAATGLILLLYLFYFSGMVFICGALLNGVLGGHFDRRRSEDLRRHPEKLRYLSSGQEINPPLFR